ncbi:hypothetical protein [Leucobacter sp. GX24907]
MEARERRAGQALADAEEAEDHLPQRSPRQLHQRLRVIGWEPGIETEQVREDVVTPVLDDVPPYEARIDAVAVVVGFLDL